MKLKIILILLISILLISSYVIILEYTPSPTIEIPDNQVIRVIDGDTFELQSGEIIRLLCIDTPEENEQGYEEAKQFLENLILNEEPTLEQDTQDKDKYNRSLRYAYLNETFINKEIYKAGHAEIMSIPPSNTKCEEIQN